MHTETMTLSSSALTDSENAPLRSVYTSNLAQLLSQNRFSLVVSTYQAGKVILVRPDGNHLNTHFHHFKRPMGLAANATRMAIGEAYQLVELYNMPAASGQLQPPAQHDAYYIPRNIHVTSPPPTYTNSA